MSSYEEKLEMVLESIGEQEAIKIKKDYPFRNERNDAIRNLCRRGLQRRILCDITGLSKNTIIRILYGRKQIRKKKKAGVCEISNAGSTQVLPVS